MQIRKKDEKEWTKKGKERRDERMGDALHSSSSGASNRLPVTDYPAPPKNNQHPSVWMHVGNAD